MLEECQLLLSHEQVYLKWAKNATIFTYFLARFSGILAKTLFYQTKEGQN